MTSQIVLNEHKSTYGGPYGFYTVTLTPLDRTRDAVTVKCEVSAHLQYAGSYTGFRVTCGLYIGGFWTDFNIHDGGGVKYDDGTDNGKLWKGTTPRTASVTVQVSNLTAAQGTITGIKFRAVHQTGNDGPGLEATNCAALVIDRYGGTGYMGEDAALVHLNVNDEWNMVLPWVNDQGTWKMSV